MRFFQVHFQYVDIGQPLVAVYPEFALTLAIEQTGRCGTVRIEDDGALAVFFRYFRVSSDIS